MNQYFIIGDIEFNLQLNDLLITFEYPTVILGIAFLLFRIWIVEYKLKDYLGYATTNISRTTLYFYSFSIILGFQLTIFNMGYFVAMPMFLLLFFWNDLPDLKNQIINRENEQDWLYIILEKLTLHFPIIIHTFYWIFSNQRFNFTVSFYTDFYILFGIYLVLFIGFDKRNPFGKNLEKPLGMKIFLGSILSFAILFILVYFRLL